MSNQESTSKSVSRRELLKALTATGSAVTAASMLPGEWAKPVVEAGLLPAHAQASRLSLTVVLFQAGSGFSNIRTTGNGQLPFGQLRVEVGVEPVTAGVSIDDRLTGDFFPPAGIGVGPQITNASGRATFVYDFCDLIENGRPAGQGISSNFSIEYSFTDQATYGLDTAGVEGDFDGEFCFE